MTQVITVDGPSGAGKGTISRILADRLGFALLDSGAIYRLAALSALRTNTALDDETTLASLAAGLDIRFDADGDSTRVLLGGEDVSAAIREERTGMAASQIAPLKSVRAALLQRQRDFASGTGLVADGRDMGTVVFPKAQYKFFLTASAQERARRRVIQLKEAGQTDIDEKAILADIIARDERDSNRSTAPLRPADDAVLIDSTTLSIEAVVETMMTHIR